MKGVHLNGIIFQSEDHNHNRSRKHNPIEENYYISFVYLIPCIFAALCYSNVFNGEFVHDDVFAIKNNPDVTGKGNLWDIWLHDYWGKPMASAKSHKSYRPLTILLFRLDYFLSQGNPAWFHTVNICLHACVTCSVAHVCTRVLQTSDLCALLASSMFAVHPTHTEAVSSIVGRADVLAALLFLLSFLAYARLYLLTCLVLAVGASLCKETGFTVLGVCVLYDVIKHGRRILGMDALLHPCLSALYTRLMAVGLTAILFLAFRMYIMDFTVPRFQPEDNPASFSDSFLTRVMTFNYLLPFNVWLLVCPNMLCYDWQVGSIPLVQSLADPRNAITIGFYAFAGVMVYTLCSRGFHHKSVSEKDANPSGLDAGIFPMGFVLMCVPFIPATNLFFTVGFVVAERVLYIPSVGFCILVAQSIVRLCESTPKLKGHILTVTVLLVLTFAGKTWHRNPIWTSRQALFLSGIQTMTTNAKMHFNMANFYKDTGEIEQAMKHYKTAIELYPDHPSYHNNLGTILTNQSQSEYHFRQALDIRPDHKGALVNLGNLLILQRQDAGFDLITKALEIDPKNVDALLSMGKALLFYNRSEEAERYIQRAIQLRPDLPDAHVYYGALYHKTGRWENAVTEYQQAFTLNSLNTIAMQNAAISLKELGRYSEAVLLLKRALSLQKESDTYYQLGMLYGEIGQNLEAVFAYKEALAIAPNSTVITMRYIQALVAINQISAANQSLTRLVQRAYNDLDVLRFAYTHKQQMGQVDEAFHYLEEAIAQAKQAGHSTLGQLYHDKADIYRGWSDFDNSLKYYKLSVELDPTLVQSYINIGTIYHIQKNYSEAEEFYSKALTLNPVHQLARENMNKLLNVWSGRGKR